MPYRILVIFSLLLSGPVWAQDAKTKARARALIKSGDSHYDLTNFDKALADYQEALKLVGHPAIIFNIAQCHRQQKRWDKALFSYKLFVSRWKARFPDNPVANIKEVERHIKAVEEQLAKQKEPPRPTPQPKADPKPDKGSLRLQGVPAGARVLVDGVFRGQGPLTAALELSPGKHLVQVQADGHLPWEVRVQIEAGKEAGEAVTLEPESSGSTLWLVSGITTAALTATFLAVGVAYNLKHNDAEPDSTEWADAGNISVASYVLTGIFAAGSAVSWFLYWRSGRIKKELQASAPWLPTAAVMPTPAGGWMATGGFRF